MDRGADRLARLARERFAIRRLADRLSRPGDQPLIVVRPSFVDHGAKGVNRDLAAGADNSGPGHLGAQLRHLDVMGHVLKPPAHHVGHEHMHRVAADIDRGKPHT